MISYPITEKNVLLENVVLLLKKELSKDAETIIRTIIMTDTYEKIMSDYFSLADITPEYVASLMKKEI